MQLDLWGMEETKERQERIERGVSSINHKWESPELNQKLAEGNVKTAWQWELDYMRARELRNGCFER